MNYFIMICGLPASGKSTLALKLSDEYNAIVVSSDQIRLELFNNINDQEHNTEVFQDVHDRIIYYLTLNRNVIFDATNISYKRRKNLLQELKKFDCFKICYLMATPYNDCLIQNRGRKRNVPENVIKRMFLNFYLPQYYEGWDDIKIKWNYHISDFDSYELFQGENGLNFINQDNPNHTLTIGEHCFKCFENIRNLNLNKINFNNYRFLISASLYHDIGKRFTKQFKNIKGESTDIAHYYNHMNVSAYDTMFYLKNLKYADNSILNTCAYIQWHMQPFFIKTEKAKKRFINLVGKEFYDNLMLLHNADVNAK